MGGVAGVAAEGVVAGCDGDAEEALGEGEMGGEGRGWEGRVGCVVCCPEFVGEEGAREGRDVVWKWFCWG